MNPCPSPRRKFLDRSPRIISRIAFTTGHRDIWLANVERDLQVTCVGAVIDPIIHAARVPFGKVRKRHTRRRENKERRITKKSNFSVSSGLNEKDYPSGRPIVTMIVGGKKLRCFNVTGRAASLIKGSALKSLFTSRARKARSLVGINGTLLDTIEERDIYVRVSPRLKVTHRFIVTNSCPFPGDLLDLDRGRLPQTIWVLVLSP